MFSRWIDQNTIPLCSALEGLPHYPIAAVYTIDTLQLDNYWYMIFMF